MTITKEAFFKPDKAPAQDKASITDSAAKQIIAVEAAQRAKWLFQTSKPLSYCAASRSCCGASYGQARYDRLMEIRSAIPLATRPLTHATWSKRTMSHSRLCGMRRSGRVQSLLSLCGV